jgi:protein involved in polysaccharide export with SLBB domain
MGIGVYEQGDAALTLFDKEGKAISEYSVAPDDAVRIGFWDREGNYRIHAGIVDRAEVALYDEDGTLLWGSP